MIKLFLHCGYHKTGSSFLQVMFAQNRNYLIENGIYFPHSKDDRNMLKGKISPGNGMLLIRAIKTKNIDLISKLLNKWIDDAISNKTESLLISSEGLFHVFARADFMNIFMEACNKSRINKIYGLLFFRDPIDHAFSVYKHRGKSGKITNFHEWIKTDYETLDLTGSFLSFFKKFEINWLFRKYTSDSGQMAKMAFEDFLNVKTPVIPKNERVNISLTLSEILMIRDVKNFIPDEFLTTIHSALTHLPKSKKGNDFHLKKFYEHIGYLELKKYKNVINNVNALLPSEVYLQFTDSEISNDIKEEVLSCTTHQLKIFFNIIRDSNKLQNKAIFFVERFLKKIKRRISI